MTRAQPLNLVHESETQRQHVRVRVPGIVEIDSGTARAQFKLHDISAGGLGFDARNIAFKPGQKCEGHLKLKLDAIAVAIPVRFSIRHFDAGSGRVGAAFSELDAVEIATIRRVVTGLLSGEIVGVGDVLQTLSRNNFTAPRSTASGAEKRSLFSSLRALAVTAAMLVVGAAALFYTAQRIDQRLFHTTASAARVSGPQFQITMPRDGVFRSLVPDDRVVAKGAPIGSFETTMLDLVRSQALQADLKASDLEALLDKAVTGTITSPCDCRVDALLVTSEQYVGKGQPVAALTPIEYEPYVVARFKYPEANRLSVGSPVNLAIDGEVGEREGRVSEIRRGFGTDEIDGDLVVVIKPDEAIPSQLISRAVEVSARNNTLRGFENTTRRGQAVAQADAPTSAGAASAAVGE
ncbi:MAG TPA: PilZ domain-containing protein [Fontimonas sp.]